MSELIETTKKVRQSSRVKKLSAAMRIVDEETRRIVMQNRIDALEDDNLFQNLHDDEEEYAQEEDDDGKGDFVPDMDEASDDLSEDKKQEEADAAEVKMFSKKEQIDGKKDPKGKSRRQTRAQKAVKVDRKMKGPNAINKDGRKRQKLDLARLFYPDFHSGNKVYFGDATVNNFPNYLSIAAKPSSHTTKRFFCSVCGYWSKYACTRCGLRYCSLKCQDIHKETRCIKFAE